MGLSGHDHHAKYIGHETHFQTVIKMCYFKIINTYSYLPALYNLEANMFSNIPPVLSYLPALYNLEANMLSNIPPVLPILKHPGFTPPTL